MKQPRHCRQRSSGLLCGLIGLLSCLAVGALAQARVERAAGDGPFKVFMVLHRAGALADVGFKDYLDATGLRIEYTVRNINNVAGLLPGIVEEIRQVKPDLVYAQSTIVTTALVGRYDRVRPDRHIVDIPVVFSMVSEPVSSGLTPEPKSETDTLLSGRNLTGAVHVVSLEVQVKAMQAFMPIKRLAVITDLTERAQRERIHRLTQLTKEAGIELVVASPLDAEGKASADRIAPAIAELAAKQPDMLYIPPVSFFADYSDLLTGEALKHRLPTFCAIEVPIRAKGLTGLVAPVYNVGQLAGFKAEQILRRRKPAGELPIETLSRFSFIVNMATARELGFYPPMNILRYAQIINE